MLKDKVGFIGTGVMGCALARGLVLSGKVARSSLLLFDIDKKLLQAVCAELKVKSCASLLELAKKSDIIVLCVKPQIIGNVLAEISPALSAKHLLVSIAAGIPLSFLESRAGKSLPVVRVMPNMPAQVGEGFAAVSLGKYASVFHGDKVCEMFESVGRVSRVDETHLDAMTAVSGSGPAYVFLMIEALSDAGVLCGLTRKLAMEAAAQTVLGSAKMLLATGEHPGVLKDRVASPGGTTAAALAVLEEKRFRGAVIGAVKAAYARSRELGGK